MILFGMGRKPGQLLLMLAIAYAIAHFILAPAGVPVAGQLLITLCATTSLSLAWTGIRRILRGERRELDPRWLRNDDAPRPGHSIKDFFRAETLEEARAREQRVRRG
jgi:hypothetical protein